MPGEKELYVVFRTVTGEWPNTVTRHDAIPVLNLVRGLQDWSGGREILGRLVRAKHADIYVARLSWEEAWDINEGRAEPPGYVQRLKDFGQEHLL